MNLKHSIQWIFRKLPFILAGLALFTIVALEAAQTIYRYTCKHTFLFVDDIAVICFSWAIFAGAAAAYREKMHYGLDILTNAIPTKIKTQFQIIVQLLITASFAFFFYYSIRLYMNVGPKVLTTTNLSYRWVDAALVYGFFMMLAYSIEFLIDDIKQLTSSKVREEDME